MTTKARRSHQKRHTGQHNLANLSSHLRHTENKLREQQKRSECLAQRNVEIGKELIDYQKELSTLRNQYNQALRANGDLEEKLDRVTKQRDQAHKEIAQSKADIVSIRSKLSVWEYVLSNTWLPIRPSTIVAKISSILNNQGFVDRGY